MIEINASSKGFSRGWGPSARADYGVVFGRVQGLARAAVAAARAALPISTVLVGKGVDNRLPACRRPRKYGLRNRLPKKRAGEILSESTS
jgi:hypothetical protein